MSRAAQGWVAVVLLSLLAAACDKGAVESTDESTQIAPEQLGAALADRVLATVGSRSITLADYTAALERMDEFERQRYQAPQRRLALLQQLITLELLAREAERRGLDKAPESRELLRQLLRDELLRQQEQGLPKLEDLPTARLHEYYDAHRKELREPERRRVAHILMKDKDRAEEVLSEALKATPTQWGELVKRYSRDDSTSISPGVEATPLELAGDLGLISAPGLERGENLSIPEPVREAVFTLQKVGQVYDKLVPYEGGFHIVRLMGISPPRDRSFAEAERTIRVQVLQEVAQERERSLIDELRKNTKVTVNEAALARVKAPPATP